MPRSAPRLLLGAVSAAALAACAHAPPAPRAARPDVFWPAPPAAPRVRLAEVIPDPDPAPVRASFWSRVVSAVTGLGGEEESDPRRQLQRPFGIAAGPAGELFVADPDLRVVARVQPDGNLSPIACRDREWGSPMALAVRPDGALLVADAGAGEIVRVERDGRCVAFGAGMVERPTGVAERNGRVFVADPPAHVIEVFDAGGGLAARLGGRGEGDGELSFPTAVAVAPDGSVLVVDALNFRIAHFAADGRWLGAFGTPGDEGGAFARPKGIAVGADGRVYVSDAQRDLVLVFLPDGSFEYAVGAGGDAAGEFNHPAAVAVAGARLHVADSLNGRVQSFDVLGGDSK